MILLILIFQYYGEQVIVNLINHTKAEGSLQRVYQSLYKDSGIPGMYYEAFDFHKGKFIGKLTQLVTGAVY